MGMDDLWDELELSDGEDNGGGADENLGDDGDDDGEEDDTYGAAQHVLVLLDCGSGMWKKFLPNPKSYMDGTNDSNNNKDNKNQTDAYFYDDNDNEDDDDDEKFISPMDQALQVLYDLVRQQVRVKGTGGRGLGSTRDGFGILLYNTKNRHQRLLSKNGYTTAAATTTAAASADENDKEEDDDDLNYKREAKTTFHQLVPLQKPGVTTIQTLRATMKDILGERDLDLEQEYAPNDNDDDKNNNNNNSAGTCGLYQALNHVGTMYKEAKCVRQKKTKDMTKEDQKHVWIFTNNDDPQNATQVPLKVNDLVQGGEYKVSLWPFPKPPPPAATTTGAASSTTTMQPEEFRYNLFYDKISVDIPFRKQQQQQQQVGISKQSLHQQQQQQQQDLRDLVRGMMSKWTKVRARFHGLPLTFPSLAAAASGGNKDDSSAAAALPPPPPPPTQISMDWYYMVQVHKEPTPITIHSEDGQPVQLVKQLVTKDTQEILVETIRGPGAAAYMRQQELEGRDHSAKWRAGKRRIFSHVLVGKDEQVPMSVQDRVDIRQAANRQATQRHCTVIGFYKMPATAAATEIGTSTNHSIPLPWCMGKSYLCLPADLSGSDNSSNNNKASLSSSSDNAKKKTTRNRSDEDNLTAFAHLHASMLRKKVWALCELLTSVKTSQSRLAALWPMERQASPNGNDDDDDEYYDESRHPPGMLVIPLPFVDELKEASPDKTDAPMVSPDAAISSAGIVKMEVDNQQLAVKCTSAEDDNDAAFKAAVDLVKKLKFQEGTELGVDFENVRLTRFWNHIENTALELPALKETTDQANDTKIDPEAALKRAGMEIQNFSESLPEDVKVEKPGKATKKVKVPIEEVGDLKVYFRSLYQENSLNERTNDDIKKFLKQEGCKLGGKKQDLINRVAEIFEKEQNETNGVRVKQEDDEMEDE